MTENNTKERTNTKKEGGKMLSNKKQTPKRLKKYRIDAGFTIYSLADRLNVNFSTVSYWENGVKHPRHDKIIELEDLFNASYRELFSDLSEEEAAELEQRMEEQKKNQGNE
jgi:transcriptional regulator with XRE-family HTH domain